MAAAPDVEYRVLGAVEVWRRGKLVVFRRTATINLLAGLLMSANKLVSAARLAEITWGSRQPEHPRAALHTKMSRLRDILGDEAILTVGGGYVLRVSPEQLDLQAFDDRIVKAMEVPGPEAADILAAAIDLWRGTPLSNADSLVLQSEVVQPLIARYLAACESWANLKLRLGQPHPVVDRLGPLVAAHPFRESLARQLMLALYRADRPADALAAYETLRKALREELGADPVASLQGLYLSILRNTLPEVPIPVEAHQERLAWVGRGPSPAGLIGRDADQAALVAAVRGYRAVTVVGAAGVGKTELALHTARDLGTGFADGVVVADLGPVPARYAGDMQAPSQAILAVAGAPAGSARPSWASLARGLESRELLLVLDNAEHIWTSCSQLVDLIVRSCPRVRVITTSRRPLGFSGERVISLDPLKPGPAAEMLRVRAAELGGDELTGDGQAVARLCQLLDGLPLALELAAARMRTTPLPTLIEQIAARRDFLAVEGRPGLPHQRGLFDSLLWSYRMLDQHSRLLLTRLAVFEGDFRVRDVERTCSAPPLGGSEVAALLSALADNSLVHTTGAGADRRYRLLAPIREFAVTQAAGDPEPLVRPR